MPSVPRGGGSLRMPSQTPSRDRTAALLGHTSLGHAGDLRPYLRPPRRRRILRRQNASRNLLHALSIATRRRRSAPGRCVRSSAALLLRTLLTATNPGRSNRTKVASSTLVALRLGVSTPASLEGSRALLPQRHALTSNREEPQCACQARNWASRATSILPPVISRPMRCPASSAARSRIAANARQPVGSTTIFIRVMNSRMAPTS